MNKYLHFQDYVKLETICHQYEIYYYVKTNHLENKHFPNLDVLLRIYLTLPINVGSFKIKIIMNDKRLLIEVVMCYFLSNYAQRMMLQLTWI